MRILKSLAKLLTRDLTGKTWEREVNHPYFGRLVYFGSKSPGGFVLGGRASSSR